MAEAKVFKKLNGMLIFSMKKLFLHHDWINTKSISQAFSQHLELFIICNFEKGEEVIGGRFTCLVALFPSKIITNKFQKHKLQIR